MADIPRKRTSTGSVVVRETTAGPVYALRYRAGGRRRYETLGAAVDGWTPRMAEQALRDQLDRIRLGVWTPPQAEKPTVAAAPAEEPTFHLLASEYVERRRREVDERTAEQWRWALSLHLLPHFAALRPSEITVGRVKAYMAAKQAEREEREQAIAAWRRRSPDKRGRMPARGLSNASINKTLKVLAQVLDEAVDEGYVTENVARGKKRRLKAARPRRTWLELHEVQALLAAAGDQRALLAAMVLTGLRVSELTALRWRDVDLAGGKLHVADAKTDAGVRDVDLSPMLLDELKVHKADSRYPRPSDLVFATGRGTRRNRSNITRQILQPAIDRANAALTAEGRPTVEGVTNHSLRRTFCALLYEAGASPAYVMQQMGHTDASLALEVYSKVMERKRDTGLRMDALLQGAAWEDDTDEAAYRALPGTSSTETGHPVSTTANKNPARAGLS
jgi:integrase